MLRIMKVSCGRVLQKKMNEYERLKGTRVENNRLLRRHLHCMRQISKVPHHPRYLQ